ncbi:zona pellucida glycoprotein 3d tandem duplicate 1 [Spinachia spinachia]
MTPRGRLRLDFCCRRLSVMPPPPPPLLLLLWWFLGALFRGALGVPAQRGTWLELGVNPVKTDVDGAPRTPHHHLPMFLHSPGPLVSAELLRPVPHRSPFPAELTKLLNPTEAAEEQRVLVARAPAVQVFCGADRVSVRVDRSQLRVWTAPSLFYLGSCQASQVDPRALYFHYRLTQCGAEPTVVGGQLVYTQILRYIPPPQGDVIRVLPLSLPIHCHYNRFHYSYQVGFKTQVWPTTFVKSIGSKLKYILSVLNAKGQPVPPDHWFYLGEPVYFVAQAEVLLAGETLYVNSCYATSSKDPNSTPKMDVISNYGCMTDSRRQDSSSRFLTRGSNVVKFSVDAFLFRAVSQVLYLHCSMSISLASSPISKSCNYNRTASRWVELEAKDPVCSCCDSMCHVRDSPAVKNTVSSPGWHIGQKDEQKPRMASQSERGREWISKNKSDEREPADHQKVQPFSQGKELGPEEEHDDLPERNAEESKWKHSTEVSLQKKGDEESETEEVVMEKDLANHGIESTPNRPVQVAANRKGSLSSFPTHNRNPKESKVGSVTTIIASNPSFDENNPSAIIPNMNLGTEDYQIATAIAPGHNAKSVQSRDQEEDFLHSKGLHSYDTPLHSVKTRGIELAQSAVQTDFTDWLLGNFQFDPVIEDEGSQSLCHGHRNQ